MAALTATTGVTAKTTSAAPDCVTVVPGEHGYVPPGSCNGYYNFDPSFEGNLAFAVLFGVSLVGHVVQANAYKKTFCWVIIMGGIWETVGFIIRTFRTRDQ